MLPAYHKMTSPVQFRRTIKHGQRAGTRTLVLHVWEDDGSVHIARQGGPRIGLVVSKAVGNAVVRHRVSRRLRHVCREFLGELEPQYDVVIRALPSSGTATSEQLARDMRKALAKVLRKKNPDGC